MNFLMKMWENKNYDMRIINIMIVIYFYLLYLDFVNLVTVISTLKQCIDSYFPFTIIFSVLRYFEV